MSEGLVSESDSGRTYKCVALHGAPRSGTTWLGEILNSSLNTIYRYQPLFSYAHKGFLTSSSTAADIQEYFSRLASCEDGFTNQTAMRSSGALPHFQKSRPTHIVYKEVRYHNVLFNLLRRTDDLALIALIRNPFSVIHSWLNAPREFRADLGWRAAEEWRYAPKRNMNKPEEFNGYERWKEAANIFFQLQQQFPERVHIVSYSKLLKNPVTETQRLFQLLELGYGEQTENFLAKSQKVQVDDPYSVFRLGQTDDAWKESLDRAIVTEIELDLQNDPISDFLS